ncbi:MAG: response regulator [Desulfomonile sp.]|nr:response regulator [Desulfomonile sp.]
MAKKILIVDDEPDMVAFLATLLEDNGYETLSAADGEEAMEKVKSDRPDLISLDLLMPNKTGIKMFRELRKDDEFKNIPVVMVTGFGKDDVPQMDFKKWIKERAVKPPEAYIEKPVDKGLFLDEVRKALEQK